MPDVLSIRASVPSMIDGISSIDMDEIPPYLRERAHHDRIRPPVPVTRSPKSASSVISAAKQPSPVVTGGIRPPRPRNKTASWRLVRVPNNSSESLLCVGETADDAARFLVTRILAGMHDDDIRRLVAVALDHWIPSGRMSRNTGGMKFADRVEIDPEFAKLANIETGSWSRVATWHAKMFTWGERASRRRNSGVVHHASAGSSRLWIPDWQAIFDEEFTR